MRIILTIILAVAVIILAAAGYFLISQRSAGPAPQITPAPTFKPSPAPSPASAPTNSPSPLPSPSQNVGQKITTFQQAVRDVVTTGKSREFTLVFTEAEVNAEATRLLTQATVPKDVPLDIKSVLITFGAGNTLLTEAQTVAYGINVPVTIKAQVGIAAGKPDVVITEINFGIFPAPQSTREQVVQLIKQRIDGLLLQLSQDASGGSKVNLEFTRINILQKEMTITVNINPAM